MISVSRPKSVMNHGRPAAGTISLPAQRSRSAARSASECVHVRSSASSLGACSVGAERHQSASDASRSRRSSLQPLPECGGVELGCPVQEPLHRDDELPLLAGREPQATRRDGTVGLVRRRREMDERPRGEAVVRELDGAGSVPVLGPRRRDLGHAGRAQVLDALDGEDVGEVGRELEREHRVRPRASERFETVTVSSSPRPTNSSRRTSSPDGQRRSNTPTCGAPCSNDTGSPRLPSIVRTERERKRVSAAKNPDAARVAAEVAALVADDEA